MGGSITSFLTMTVAGRAIMPDLEVFQVMEMRSVIGWFILLPLVFASGGFAAMRNAECAMSRAFSIEHSR